MFDRVLLTIAKPIARVIYPLRVIGRENIPQKRWFYNMRKSHSAA